MQKQILIKRTVLSVILVGVLLFLLTACSGGSSSIVGDWTKEGKSTAYISFYEDGSYSGPDYLAGSEYTVQSYSILSDGTIILKQFGGGAKALKRVSSTEPDSYSEYYMSGDTLIIGGGKYVRLKATDSKSDTTSKPSATTLPPPTDTPEPATPTSTPIPPTPTPTIAPKPPQIPENTKVYKGHSYKLFDTGFTWIEANLYCEDLGGHLVTINDELEQKFVELILTDGTKNSYWIGGYRTTNNNFTWVTGELMNYTNWAPGQPDNWTGSDDCLMIYRLQNPEQGYSLNMWNDMPNDGECNGEEFFGISNFGFICEWETTIQ